MGERTSIDAIRAAASRLLCEARGLASAEWALGAALLVGVGAASFSGVGVSVGRASERVGVALASDGRSEQERKIEQMQQEIEQLQEEMAEAADDGGSFWGALGGLFGGPLVGTAVGEAIGSGESWSPDAPLEEGDSASLVVRYSDDD
jgi:hypothetical protein